ncbi:MAG: 30S ribosomal protein S7 [Phycisphaerales bacterium]|nr:30S ribosomal protein S7 [Phycisphaerae bacterium]NNF44025.1 30S ribosomal protein S7 [Phycisphaerales bacterium]NNM27662.1 30S ribosomal protein S7 [Phycisphaerales bacterium]
MAGRITKSDQQLRPDPRHGDKTLAKFINCVMHDGKKSVAQNVVYDALDLIQKRIDKDKAEDFPKESIEVFHKAINNVRPDVEVRSKRVGGANYQVPMQVNQRRRQSLCFRWIINAARGESGKPMCHRLAKELYEAARGEGKAMATREQTHRMAEANKAFAHFAW